MTKTYFVLEYICSCGRMKIYLQAQQNSIFNIVQAQVITYCGYGVLIKIVFAKFVN